MPKQPTAPESPALTAEREKFAAVQGRLAAFDRHTAALQEEIAKFESVIAKMHADYDAKAAAAAAALESGDYVPAPFWDEARQKELLEQVKDRQDRLERSLYSNYKNRDAERRALQQNVNEAADRLAVVENASELASMSPALLAELQALAARMKPAAAATFEGFAVERTRDRVKFTFTVTLAAAGKKGQAA